MYKRLVLYSILTDLYPDTPISCGTTYASISISIDEPLVQEMTIQEKYPHYLLKHNLMLLRRERNQRLPSTDIYALPDYPHASAELKQEWLAYRQALRDMTKTNPMPVIDDDDNLIGIVWPSRPV